MAGCDVIRTPRLQVLLDGAELAGVMAADVFATSSLSADRFRVQLAGVADVSVLQRPGVRVSIAAALADEAWTPLLTGQVDSLSWDAGYRVLDVEGRDLSAVLMETQAGETFANQTASEIVETVAGRNGLAADVTATGTPVGRYYQGQHDRMTLGQYARAQTEWDLLAWLAGQEGFELGMVGERLSFGPRDGIETAVAAGDCSAVSVQQQIGLSRPLRVTVRSWGTRTAKAVEAQAEAEGAGPVWAQGIVRPNLTADEAERLAKRTVADLQRHAWTGQLSMPGELALTARSRIGLSGAGAGWDRAFNVVGLDRHVDVRRGFTQHLELQGVPDGAAA